MLKLVLLCIIKSGPTSRYIRSALTIGTLTLPYSEGELQTQEEQVSQEARTKPKVFYGWFIVAAGMGLHLWVSICWVYGMQVFFTPIVSTFGWSRGIVSGAFGLQRLEGSIIAPIEGFWSTNTGRERWCWLGP